MFELYRDEANEWRWRLVQKNGRIIAESGEGYKRRAGAENGMAAVRKIAPDARIVIVLSMAKAVTNG